MDENSPFRALHQNTKPVYYEWAQLRYFSPSSGLINGYKFKTKWLGDNVSYYTAHWVFSSTLSN